SLLLRAHRPRDQSFLDARRSAPLVRVESGSGLWNRRYLVSGGERARRSEKDLQRRNGVAGAASGSTGWPACRVQPLLWPPVATALAGDHAGCWAVTIHVR